MPLTRTHNLDITNSDIKRKVLWSAEDDNETKVEIGIADAGAIYAMLSDLSAKKGAYVLREAFSNAYDATVATGDMSRPIEITIPSEHAADTLASKIYGTNALVDMVIVTDHGIGMDYDTIAKYFLQYGGSNKRDQIDAIGSKGLGSKAPLAIADTFTVTSTKDGITTTAVIERKPGAAGTARCTTKRTNAPSGTTISIPVQDPNVIQQMNDFTEELAKTNINATLIINGERIESSLPNKVGEHKNGYVYIGEITINEDDENPCNVRIWEPLNTAADSHKNQIFSSNQFPIMGNVPMSQVDIILGGVRYQLPNTDTRYRSSNICLVAVDPGWLNFTPSRDDIKDDEAAYEFTHALQTAWSNLNYTQVLKKYLTINSDKDIMMFLSQCDHIHDHTNYSYYSRPYTSRAFWIENLDNGISIMRNDSRYSRHSSFTNCITFSDTDLREIRDWLPGYTKEYTSDNIHLLHSSAKDNNGTIFTLSLDGRDIKKSKVSSLMNNVFSHHPKMMNFADVLAASTKTNTIVLTNIDDIEKLKLVIRRENIYRAYRERMDASPLDKQMDFIVVNDESNLDDIVRQILKDNGVRTISYATFLEDTKSESKHRRQKTISAKQLRKTQNLADIPEIKQLAGRSLEIPDYRDTTKDNILVAITGNNLRMNDGSEQKLTTRCYQGYEIADKDNDDQPFKHIAVDISPLSEDIATIARTWTLAIMLSRLAGTNIVPDYITHVYVTSGKCLKRSSDLLVEGGATILNDQRSIASKITDTIAAKYHINETRNRLDMCANTIFSDDDEDALRFKMLQNVQPRWAHPLNTVILVYDLIKPYATDEIISEIITPLSVIAEHRKLVKRKYFNDDSIALWTTADGREIDLSHTTISIIDDPVGYHAISHAYNICLKAIEPYVNVFSSQITTRMPDDSDVKKISDAFGPILVYNIEKEL